MNQIELERKKFRRINPANLTMVGNLVVRFHEPKGNNSVG